MKRRQRSRKRTLYLWIAMGFLGSAVASLAQGLAWTVMDSGVTSTLYDISVVSSDFIVVVGGGSTVLKYNGTSWSPFGGMMDTDPQEAFPGTPIEKPSEGPGGGYGPTAVFYAVTAIAEDDIWIGSYGDARGVSHWDGSIWSERVRGSANDDRVFSLWHGGSDLVLNGRSNGRIGRYDGTSWSRKYSAGGGANVYDIHGVRDGEIWAVGTIADKVVVSTDNGQNWTARNDGLPEAVYQGVFSLDASHTWLATDQGIVFWDGESYTWQLTGANVADIYAFSADSVWSVGTGGAIHYYDGIQWAEIEHGLTTRNLNKIDADEMGNIYIVGNNGVILSTIPEPGTLAILLLPALLLLRRKMR